jgi:dipeptidyl aminopeptidase/acylaminoacyl peptidase
VRLSAGGVSARVEDIAPDGSRVLVGRQLEDFAERPYTRTELWEIDLTTFAARKLRDFRWLDDVSYAPDGKRLLAVGGPSAFGAVGVNVPAGMTPNESDGQLYLWDPAADKVEPLSRDFDPAIANARFSRADGHVYLRAAIGDEVGVFRYRLAEKRFERLILGIPVVSSWTLAESAPVLAAAGTGPWQPRRLVVTDLGSGTTTTVVDPSASWLGKVRRGRLEEWSCTTAKGAPIPGRIYLPVGFEASKKYPVIVYYYAGTTPVTRDFAGRYPKEWWAARGYVVYVPEPSGATGYGQEHSARHVNEWGSLVVDEIIDATKQFLAAHPYADAAKVGCIGASYGGFTTMSLVAATDMFAAAVAHAGISSISSYWGEGYWGYSYNATSAAGSFPWNRPELYVKQSPLFRADKVKTPILLTHGTVDTNVPPGESETFFTALRMLGAPVEYLQIEGQNHAIMEHAKRIIWSRAIVAWFDRHLKGQPEWWNDMMAPPEKGK